MARILVVDDDALVGRAVARMLAGHAVVVVHSAIDALELHVIQPFDLVISEIVMARKSGIQLYDELEARKDAHRLVFFTGAATEPDVRDFLERVPNMWLEKPCSREALLAIVAAALLRLEKS